MLSGLYFLNSKFASHAAVTAQVLAYTGSGFIELQLQGTLRLCNVQRWRSERLLHIAG